METRSLPSLARSLSRIYGPKPALGGYIEGSWHELNWLEVWAGARSVALRLIDSGFDAGGTCLVVSGDSPRSIEAELGVQACGGKVCRVYPATSTTALSRFLSDFGASFAFVSGDCGEAFGDTLASEGAGLSVNALPDASPGREEIAALDRFSDDPGLEERLDGVGPDSIALFLEDDGGWKGLTQGELIDGGIRVASSLGANESDTWLYAGRLNGRFQRVHAFSSAIVSCGQLGIMSPSTGLLEAMWLAKPSRLCCPGEELVRLDEGFRSELGSMQGLTGRLTRWSFDVLSQGNRGVVADVAGWIGRDRLLDILGGRLATVIVETDGCDDGATGFLAGIGVQVRGPFDEGADPGIIDDGTIQQGTGHGG